MPMCMYLDGAQVQSRGTELPFFIDFLKTAGLFDAFVADCPLHYTSPNAPKKRDVLGTASPQREDLPFSYVVNSHSRLTLRSVSGKAAAVSSQFTLADISVAPYMFCLAALGADQFLSRQRRPRVKAWYDNLAARPGFKTAVSWPDEFGRWLRRGRALCEGRTGSAPTSRSQPRTLEMGGKAVTRTSARDSRTGTTAKRKSASRRSLQTSRCGGHCVLGRHLAGLRQHRNPRQHGLRTLNPESDIAQDPLDVSGREAHGRGIIEHAAQQVRSRESRPFAPSSTIKSCISNKPPGRRAAAARFAKTAMSASPTALQT